MYKIGFQTCKHIHLSFLDQFRYAEQNNVPHFDIFFDDFLPSRFSDNEISFIKEMIKKNISFSIHSPIDNYAYYHEFLDGVIDFTNEINAFSITFHFDKISFKTIEAILKRLNKNIKLSIENTIPDYSYLYSKNYLEFIKELNSHFKDIYLTFDAGHCFVNKYNPYDYLKYLIDSNIKISTFHFHNNNGDEDSHHYLKNGKIDFKGIASLIKNLNYDFVIIIEHWHYNLDSYNYLLEILK
ncbi:MAG TPA: sugar phosphate isomerase/epimerase [Spirochaetota bacterium]|nr:sugar phosphate isomerase/epimerase [Spirochaetota bacterium]HOL57049.1 sugar phosphate isomerase/epimerase [Spirochaetota bacterium]HPP04650.1 sugar phosphate isomerase/epimerase [Spirochaetota bacterium]